MDATEPVKVTVDLDRVAKNLRAPGGGGVGEETARSFLHYVGFKPQRDGTWVGPRAGLRQFNPGEVVGVEPLRG
jgi:hypothetical protein